MRTLKAGQTLTLKLAGAVTANQLHWEASWINTITDTPDQLKGATNDTTAVVAVTEPSSGVHLLSHVDVVNKDTSAATVILEITGGTAREIVRRTLAAGESADLLNPKGGQGDPGPAGSGDVDGPEGATDSHLAAFDGATGKLLKGAGKAVSDLIAVADIVTSVGTPGADNKVPSEQAVREAIAAIPAGGSPRWTALTGVATTARTNHGLYMSTDPAAQIPADGNVPNISNIGLRITDSSKSPLKVYAQATMISSGVGTPHAGTCQDGGTSTTVVLASGASAVDDAYNGLLIELDDGQFGLITDYVGSTRTATVTAYNANTFAPAGAGFDPAPDSSNTYDMYNVRIDGQALSTGSGHITAVDVSTPEMVGNVVVTIPGVYADSAAELPWNKLGVVIPWSMGPAYITGFKALHKTPDGTTQPKINLHKGSSYLCTNDSNAGIQLSDSTGQVDQRWVRAPVGTMLRVKVTNEYFPDIECTAAGADGDAEDLTVCIPYVLE